MSAKRRDFLKILGIGGAAGLAGCSRTAPDALVPYVTPPEEMVRGHALWFRTTCRECPAGCGIEARVREGRVHKLEGNPVHPVNAGGLCARGQAAVQGLYNPDRLRTPLLREPDGRLRPAAWEEAQRRFVAGLSLAGRDATTVITGAETGALAELAGLLGRHIRFEPVAYEDVREANRLCFGTAALPVLRFAEARAIYVFGADVIETFVSPVGYARGIAEARRAGGRLVYIGSRLSLTGAHADQWVAVKPGDEGLLAMALLKDLLAAGGGAHLVAADREKLLALAAPYSAERAGVPRPLVFALAEELRNELAIAVTGGTMSAGERGLFTALAVNLLNIAAGAINERARFDRASALDRATGRTGLVDWEGSAAVVIAGANPAYSVPGFAAKLREARLVVALASWPDETVEAADIVLPVHTALESWGEYEPWAGVHSLQQPAMRPVFDTREPGEVLLETVRELNRARIAEPNFREYLRTRWRRVYERSGSRAGFEAFWSASLKRGGCWLEAPERRVKWWIPDLPEPAPLKAASYRLETYPSLAHFDGRGANRPWLQELPDPVTQAVWDSWIEVNPKDAAALRIRTGDRVRVRSAHGEVEVPAYVYPGIGPGAVAMPLGQGHTAFGRYATGVGVDAARLLDPTAARWSGDPVEIALVNKGRDLAVVSGHDLQEHRGIARSRAVPGEEEEHEHHPEMSLYAPHVHEKHRWGMAIDLDACNGCSACVAACYAENNVPVVGREESRRGRGLSWIRVERFFGPGNKVAEPFQIDLTLMLCQQCDKAPCEPVCPVFASYHTDEGLNGQVYNRCVGTRYCSNNCPYKTRRFNWFEAEFAAPLDWQLNPDVTVRSKGVMEKCTFCVQRITAAKDRARREGRPLLDGEVAPACAQSCPTGAIVFGDLNDPESRVSRVSHDPRRYVVFEELNTRPAVTYLVRVRRGFGSKGGALI